MGALAVPLPCRLGSLIGYAGEGRRGRDPSSQKGLGGALRESGYLATGRWPGGYPAQRAGEAARPQPTHPGLWRGAAPGPQALPGAPGSRLGPGSRKTVSAVGVLEQASTLLPDRRRGPAPHSHPVFVPGAGGHCVRAGNGGPGNPLPPPPRPGPLGNSKNTSGVSGGSPAFSLPERPGDGLSEVRLQIRGSCPFPPSLIETLSPIEKYLQGFGSLTLGRYLNRKNNNKKTKAHTSHLWENSSGSQ